MHSTCIVKPLKSTQEMYRKVFCNTNFKQLTNSETLNTYYCAMCTLNVEPHVTHTTHNTQIHNTHGTCNIHVSRTELLVGLQAACSSVLASQQSPSVFVQSPASLQPYLAAPPVSVINPKYGYLRQNTKFASPFQVQYTHLKFTFAACET